MLPSWLVSPSPWPTLWTPSMSWPMLPKKCGAHRPIARLDVGLAILDDFGPNSNMLSEKLGELPQPPNCHRDADYTHSRMESEHMGTRGRWCVTFVAGTLVDQRPVDGRWGCCSGSWCRLRRRTLRSFLAAPKNLPLATHVITS